MNLVLLPTTKRVQISKQALLPQVETLARRALASKPGMPAWQEVTIYLVDDERMDEVHQAVMGLTGATDVITLRYEAMPGEPEGDVGELFVDVEWALAHYPRREDWSAEREILLYIAHGFDHLTGEDDQTPETRRRMRRRELSWLRAVDKRAFLR